jgi:hypothetical protein
MQFSHQSGSALITPPDNDESGSGGGDFLRRSSPYAASGSCDEYYLTFHAPFCECRHWVTPLNK